MEMNHTGLFYMHQESEVLDKNTMDYWMEKVELAQSIPEAKQIMKQFESHRRFLASIADHKNDASAYRIN